MIQRFHKWLRHFLLPALLMIAAPVVLGAPDRIDLEPVAVTGGPPVSVLIESAALMDFGGRPTGRRPPTRPSAHEINFLWNDTIPIKLEHLDDEPQFAPFLERSIEELELYTKAIPEDPNGWTVLGVRLYQTNEPAQSLKALTQARQSDPLHERSAELFSAILIQAGDPVQAQASIRRMLDELPHNRILRFNAACGYARQTNATEAMYHLGILADMGWQDVRFYLNDPDLDPIRPTTAFQAWEESLDRQARISIVNLLRTSPF